MNSEKQQSCVEELTKATQTYIKEHPDTENGYQMEALVYKQFGMLDKQKEILKNAMEQPIAAPRCAIMLADIEFRENKFEESLKSFKRAIADSDKTETAVHDGYLYVMTALCKLALAKQKNVGLNKEEVLDIYEDFNVALCYNDNLKANYKDVLAKKTLYLIDKYNVPVPQRNKQQNSLVEELKKGQ